MLSLCFSHADLENVDLRRLKYIDAFVHINVMKPLVWLKFLVVCVIMKTIKLPHKVCVEINKSTHYNFNRK